MDGELNLFYHQQHYLSLNQVRAAYSKEALTRMQGSLWREGWKEVEGLPSGWRSKGTSYLSPLMEEVTSKEALLTFLDISKEYRADEVKKTRQALLRK